MEQSRFVQNAFPFPKPNLTRRRLLIFFGQLLITATLGVILVLQVDLGQFAKSINSFPLWSLFTVSFVIFLTSPAVAHRWRVVLATMGEQMGIWTAYKAAFLAMAFSQFLPSTLGGDAARIWYVYGRLRIPIGRLVAGAFLDRVTALASLAILSAFGLPVLLLVTNELAVPLLVAVLVAGSVGAICVLLGARFVGGWPGRLATRSGIIALSTYAWLIFSNGRVVVTTLALSSVVHLTVVGAVAILGAVSMASAPWWSYLVLVPPITLLSMAPVSIAGWGVREGGFVAGFALVGVPLEMALALGVAVGMVQIGAAVLSAGAWFVSQWAEPFFSRSGSDTPHTEGTD